MRRNKPTKEQVHPDSPEEGDYITYDHVKFYQYGKLVTQIYDESDWKTVIKAHMDHNRFWPNVWFVSDHGNAHMMNCL